MRPCFCTSLLFCLFTFSIPALAQTKWFKYEGNPVLEVGPPGAWDAVIAVSRSVILRDSVYHMYYLGTDGVAWKLGHATSPDGIKWTKDRLNPVLSPTLPWEENIIYSPAVIYTGTEFKMWYAAHHRIGYATSVDGSVWTKRSEPVLSFGPSSWDACDVDGPWVVGPDSVGQYKMWYEGWIECYTICQIGYATSGDEITWVKAAMLNPILTIGRRGFWDDKRLQSPTVLYSGRLYEMWYAGSRTSIFQAQTGYATSLDGTNWTKDSLNPVLPRGPVGSWDSDGTGPAGVLCDGSIYHLWYAGNSGPVVKTGYAVSPKGMQVSISPEYVSLDEERDQPVHIVARVDDPRGLSFSAKIRTVEEDIDIVALFDDGEHGDSLSGDGVFANHWSPKEEQVYFVDLKLKLKEKKTLGFEMKNADAFTTIGPITCDSMEFVGDKTPNPGDELMLKLMLRNRSFSAAVRSVETSISPTDTLVTNVSASYPSYGDILPQGSAWTTSYHKILIDPNFPLASEVNLMITISSLGAPLWHSAVSFRVLPPWWRTIWAYALYGLLGLALLYGIRRFEVRRTRKKHQLELERFQTEKLKELDQLKSRFFANISHEFRTPLTLIEGPLKQMLSGDYEGNAKEQYDLMLRNTRRLTRLVNQLLDLSKIESGQMKLGAKRLDICHLVRRVAAAFESLAKRKGCEYSVLLSEEPIIGWFDRDAVEKIVTNLLSNAFKFTQEGGAVEVLVKQNDISSHNVVILTVTDTGIGIPPDQFDKIFDRFYQVDASRTREQEGTGIGLALTKELVELHKGEINVKSEVGKGSAFTVRLPLGKEHLKQEEIIETDEAQEKEAIPIKDFVELDESPALEEAGNESLPVLLMVEDNADMRKYMHACLDNKYRVIEAANGAEGVRKAIEEIPDLIISDVMMPKMEGHELCRIVKHDEKTSHIPIILLTAKAGTESKIEGFETGADDYFIKPFDAKELLVRVKNLIEQRGKLREKFQRELVVQPLNINVQSIDEKFLVKAFGVIEANLSDPDFDTTALAHEVAMSRMQLHRKLRALTNLSSGELIRSFRMKRAASLLQQKSGNISEVAYEVGYNNPAHFAQVFREHFGVSPSEYIRSQKTKK